MIKNINNISIYIFITFIFTFIYLIYIFSFKDISWIAFTDHDEGYLLEQLTFKIKNIKNNFIVSAPATYGVEFYYLKYFFKFFEFFFDFGDFAIYSISTFIHLILFLSAIAILFKIFKILQFKNIYYLIFALSLLLSPEIIFFSFNLKPDLNLLLFLFSLTLYFYIQFKIKKKEKHLFKFTFALCLSLCIKGWSLPFVIFLIFILHNLDYNFYKIRSRFKILLFFIFVTILNFYLFSFGDFLVNSHEEMKLFFKDETVIFIKNYFFKNFLIYIILNLLSFLIFYHFFIKFNLFYKLQYIFFCGAVWFIAVSPFVLDLEIFLKSIYGFSKYTIINQHLANYQGLTNNFFQDIVTLKINPIFTAFLIIIFPIVIFKKKLIFNHNKINFAYEFYFCFVIMFIFSNSISTYPNQYPVKYLYYLFYILFSFYFLIFFDKKKLLNLLFINMSIFLFLFMIFINFDKFKNISNYNLLESKIYKLIIDNNKIYFENKNIVACGGYLPTLKSINMKIFNVPIKKCLKKTKYFSINKIDYFFINNNHYDLNLIDYGYNLVDNKTILVVGRFGDLKKVNYSLYKNLN